MSKKFKRMISGLMTAVFIFSGCGGASTPAENSKTFNSIAGDSVSGIDGVDLPYMMEEERLYGEMPEEIVIEETEEYAEIIENTFISAKEEPVSTFSIDVDTASYSNVRRMLNYGRLPEPDAVRIEEFINYFNYDYEEPDDDKPFKVTMQMGTCPWNDEHYVAMVNLKGKEIAKENWPKSNLVFLLDVSGSMDEPDKLPLLKKAFKLLVNELTENDRVSIVVYAGASGTVLKGARGDQKDKIISALNKLEAGGSTAGAEGIELAYSLAEKYYIEGGNNRVILATDGDFNVGPSSVSELEALIEEKRDKGIFLSVLGFGTGNLKDNKMETLADKGNGNYAYIDSIKEAEKVLVHEMVGTLVTIAKDVKIQAEFNPKFVKEYRLIGYENRKLNNEDFEDDRKDAGEIGAGHTVTALYEIVPADGVGAQSESTGMESETNKNALMFVRVRYKEPDADTSQLMEFEMAKNSEGDRSKDFQFATAVAEFGLLLRDSKYKGNASYDSVIKRAKGALGKDEGGYRKEFVELVKEAKELAQMELMEEDYEDYME